MPNQEHLEWLLAGVESWNRRRKTQSFKPDLENADIPKLFVEAEKLEFDYASRIPLKDINLTYANLKNASLSGADLREGNLFKSELQGADLSWADLQDANVVDAQLDKETKLHDANLIYTNLSNTSFGKAILYKAPDEGTPKLIPKREVVGAQVSSINDILEICEQLQAHYKSYQADEIYLYFRGEERYTWDLEPSVMRGKTIRTEGEMLIDLTSRQPQAFHNTPLTVEQWILAQHYRLKTRLLDITRSPLVALYNSCHKKLKRDGALHIFAIPKSLIKPYSSDKISIVANFAKLTPRDQAILTGDKVGASGALDYRRTMRRLYHLIRHEKPFFEERINPIDLFGVYVVEPRRSFERIRAQSGAFLLSAYHRRFEPEVISDFNVGVPIYNHYKLTVPLNSKESVLRHLELSNLTRETMFPGLDESAKAVNRRFSDSKKAQKA